MDAYHVFDQVKPPNPSKIKQNFYQKASNLVIQGQAQPRSDEPTGEPVSLLGKIDIKQFGEFVQKEKPRKTSDPNIKKDPQQQKKQARKAQKKQRKKGQILDPKRKARMELNKGLSVLTTDIQEMLLYKPKTSENKIIYEQLLSRIQLILGDESQETLRSVTDEALAILKNDNLKDQEKKKELEGLIKKFAELLGLSKQITDYTGDIEEVIENIDKYEDEIKFGVVFEDEEEESSEESSQNKNESNDEEQDDLQSQMSQEDEQYMQLNQDPKDLELMQEDLEEQKFRLDVSQIDAYWLETLMNQYFNDPLIAKKMHNEIMKVLNLSNSMECENALVSLLNYDKYSVIKLLIHNRLKIYYLTLLGQAQDKEEKDIIIEEMQKTEEGQQILKDLDKVKLKKDTETENIAQVRREAALISQTEAMKQSAKQGSKTRDDDQGLASLLEAVELDDEEFLKMNKQVIDLESMSFEQGSHFMSNEKCQLPQGSYKLAKKGYDEIYVPAVRHLDNNQNLVKINTLPKWAQPAFPSYMKELNRIQSAVYNSAFKQSDNMLVCAPTGAGKTNIALLSILQIIGNAIRNDGSIDKDSFKVVYIAPMKALVNEMVGNFKNRLENQFGLTIRELTGDMQLSKAQIQETQIIVATPEKWDIITRKSGEKTYLEKVRLMVIDEVHLLHDSRGPVLEALVARTIRLIESTQEMIRIIGLSATLPNFADVATFLRVDAQKGLFYFDHTYRPVPLEQQFIGITEKKAVRKMLLQNEILYEKVVERAGKFQMIIFVHTRKDTVKTAKILKEMAFAKDDLSKFLKPDSASKIILEQERDQAKSQDLKELLPFGFAVHHAGLPRLDRNLVEELFYDNHIQVLVSTATLAWGVNLPAHTVILKGTQVYSPEQGKWVELSAQDILQMIGRAGRPGMDTKGEGIIITGYQELKYYLSLLNQQLPIESQFVAQLPDQLNAEIVLGTVNSLKEAVHWLGYTYFYVRMLRAPALYGIDGNESDSDKLLVRRRTELIHSAATLLDKAGLIRYERKTGLFMSTQLGKIASHYYIKHASINIYNQHVKPQMGIVELFKVFSLSNEFKHIPIRDEEKVELQKLLESVPLPVKGNAGDPTTKVNVLLQSYISRLKMDGLALNADMVYVTQSASRILRALFEIFLSKHWAEITETTLSVCKMVDKRMWGCMTPLRQFKAIPNEIIRRIERNEALSWDHLYNMNANQIGELIKFQKLGKVLHKFIHQFPRLELNALVQPITRSCLRIDLSITTDFQWDSKIHSSTEPFWIMVEDCDGEVILYSEFFVVKEKFYNQQKEYIFEFTVPLFEPLNPIYYIKVISDRWISSETQLPISFKSLILPEKFSPSTELLDRQLLPTSTLKISECDYAFKMLGIREFNSIQTQVFQSFFNSDESVYLGSSTGSGKTTCSLLALFRLLNHPQESERQKKCIYIAPLQAICEKYYQQWHPIIKLFKRSSGILTGNLVSDLKIIEKNQVIFTAAEYWDMVSKRWNARQQLLRSIGLVIIDELHLLGENSSVLEAITSRIRIFTSQLGLSIRIIALASSIADYRDIAEWLGMSANNTFNFHSNIRPIPLDIIIQPFNQAYRKARMLQMEKYLLTVLSNQLQVKSKQQTIIFVPDRKQARLTALSLVSFLGEKFLGVEFKEIEELVEKLKEKNLKHCVSNGIGILYEGIDNLERQIVEQLFEAQAISTLICTYKLSWEINQDANFVIIFDTQRYDGQERRYIDYTIPDILQMIGRTQKIKSIQRQSTSKCLVLCYGPKRDYYRKFLNEPYPVESHLNHYFAEHLNTEVVSKNIKSKQDCVDWLTWTFMYRRLTRNPNYYNLQEISGQHINDYISELIESVVDELEKSRCLAVENELDLIPLNLGMIASYYYIKHSTIQTFSEQLSSSIKMHEIIQLLSNAAEFEQVPIRHREEQILKQLCSQIEYKPQKAKFNEPNTKTNILLQCHFKRIGLSPDFTWDQKVILEHAVRLIQAIVDVISSNNWLKPAILALQLCQMLVQACELKSSPLLQLPHINQQMVDKLNQIGIQDIADFLNMEDEDRNKIVVVNEEEMEEIANACNRYPNINLKFEVINQNVIAGENCVVEIELERDPEDYTQFVVAPYYPKEKEEKWWVMIGQPKENQLLAMKKISFNHQQKIQLNFVPEVVGEQEFSLYLVCDSYIGCDQKENFKIHVEENTKQEEEDEIKDEEMELEEN